MTQRYFRVRYESGAYIENLYYAKDDIVPLDVERGKEPLWGVEVDANGNEIGPDRSAAVQDKLASGLANKIAGKPAPTNEEDTSTGGGAGLTDVQKDQVKEALGLLDHNVKEHWTSRGLPNTETVSGIVGFSVERKDINEIAPEFVRKEPEKA